MDIQKLSTHYTIRLLQENDIDKIFTLAKNNTLYYEYCPPFVTKESIREDMKALPPKKTAADKYYLGFFDGDNLIAIMDLIIKYPNDDTAFIGLFMVDKTVQGKGIGSSIINECCSHLKRIGFLYIRLGYVEGNPQSRYFWQKNGFEDTGIKTNENKYTVIVLQKKL